MPRPARASGAAAAVVVTVAGLGVLAAPPFAGADAVRPSPYETEAGTGMQRMHELMVDGNPGMQCMHESMHGSPR